MMNFPMTLKSCVLATCGAFVLFGCAGNEKEEVFGRCDFVPQSEREDCVQRAVDSEQDQWKEQKTTLPGLPAEENLRPLDMQTGEGNYSYFVDRTSVSRGKDDVMRYTVMLRSNTGVTATFHEGLRCASNEAITYGYVSETDGFQRSSNSRWHPVSFLGIHVYQDYLAKVIMCDKHGFARDAEKAVKALDDQFTAGGVRVGRSCTESEVC